MTDELYQKTISSSWDEINIFELLTISRVDLKRYSDEELNGLIAHLVFDRPMNHSIEAKLTPLVDWIEERLGTQETGMIVVI